MVPGMALFKAGITAVGPVQVSITRP